MLAECSLFARLIEQEPQMFANDIRGQSSGRGLKRLLTCAGAAESG